MNWNVLEPDVLACFSAALSLEISYVFEDNFKYFRIITTPVIKITGNCIREQSTISEK